MTQFQKRESTDIHQSQGLRILTDFLKPEVTVGTVVKFQVFYSRMTRIHVDAQLVVCGLASIFDTEAKVDYIIIGPKSFSWKYIRSFYWAYYWNPLLFWLRIWSITANIGGFIGYYLKLISLRSSIIVLFLAFYYLIFIIFKLGSRKYSSIILQNIMSRKANMLIVALHLSDNHFALYLIICLWIHSLLIRLKQIFFIITVACTVHGLLYSLFKFKKHCRSILILTTVSWFCIVQIIREFEFW